MPNTNEICLLLGCGPRGLEWVKKQREEKKRNWIAVDAKPLVANCDYFQQASILHRLPFDDASVRMIWADFLLNGIDIPNLESTIDLIGMTETQWRDLGVPEIIINSLREINLEEDLFRKWMSEIGRPLMQTMALKEIWRVLTPGYEGVTILDKREICEWIVEYAARILEISNRLVTVKKNQLIDAKDEKRSDARSLRVMDQHPNVAKKIKLLKTII